MRARSILAAILTLASVACNTFPKETQDGGWSWDRTVVSTTLTFVNQDLVAIGNLPDRYKDRNPFRPDVWIQQDVTVKHR